MVLEDSTNADPFASASQPSDFDPYSADIPTTSGDPLKRVVALDKDGHPITIDFDKLPHPFMLPIGTNAQFESVYIPMAAKVIGGQMAQITKVMQRPVRQEEAEAVAFHQSKAFRTLSFAPTVGALITAIFSVRTAKEHRFPGWLPFKEGSRFRYDVFGPLRGWKANLAWKSARIGAWFIVWEVASHIFFSAYSRSVLVVGRLSDPRLHDMNETLKQKIMENRANQQSRPVQQSPWSEEQQRTEADGQSPQYSEGSWTAEARQANLKSWHNDDGSVSTNYGNVSRPSNTVEGALSPRPAQKTGESNQPRTTSSQSQSRSRRQPKVDDDASPTASGQTSGSAWERIRQNAVSAGGDGVGETPARNTPSDDFTFASQDRDRQLAKWDAQKEFDARMEQERQGKDFGSGGKGRGW